MPLEFVLSEKGKQKLKIGSFLFNREKLSGTKTLWACDKKLTQKCKARVHTQHDTVVAESGVHSHAAAPGEASAAVIKSRIRERAATTMDPTRSILVDSVQNAVPHVAAVLPTEGAIRRSIQRIRVRATGAPANPTSLTSLVIPQDFQVTQSNQPFLFFDSGPGAGNDRILIFATNDSLALLAQSRHYYADGTFSVTPELYQDGQLYTIHARMDEQIFPCVYALLPNKSKEAYTEMLDALISNAGFIFNPETLMLDFEKGAHEAFGDAFPNAQVVGCFFHLSQCCWRKLQDVGVQDRYNDENDPNFSVACRMVPALAFVPEDGVVQAFRDVAASIPDDYNLDDFLSYFERTYIGCIIAGRQRQPLFPPEIWNQYTATLDGRPRTNNAVEGWHNAFRQTVGGSHPTLWRLITGLKKEEGLNAFRFSQMVAGHPPPQKKKKYEDLDSRIQISVGRFGNVNILPYLRGIAHNVRF